MGAVVAGCPAATAVKHWIELEVVGEDGVGIAGLEYHVELPDGAIARGYLSADGFARIQGVPAGGLAKVRFPELDGEAWRWVEQTTAKAMPLGRAASQG